MIFMVAHYAFERGLPGKKKNPSICGQRIKKPVLSGRGFPKVEKGRVSHAFDKFLSQEYKINF